MARRRTIPRRKAATISGGSKAGSARQQRRGVALIMVMLITTVLGAIAADLSNASQVNLQAAANARDQLQAHFHARSALELELFVLRYQGMIKKTIGQFLPIPLFELSTMLVSSDTVKGIIDPEGPKKTEDEIPEERSFALDAPFGEFQGSFWIEQVVDENRKININAGDLGVGCQNYLHLMLGAVFDDPKYNILFENLGESRDAIRNRIEIISNITDWSDGDDIIDPVCILTKETGGTSAEDARYDHQPYEVQYRPKNGLFTSLEELRMVPGVNDAFMRVFQKYLTVWGDTKGISVKTADPWMLATILRAAFNRPIQPSDKEAFERFFQEWALFNALPGSRMALKVETLITLAQKAGLPVDPTKLQDMAKKNVLRFDDVSNMYRITAIGRVNNASSRITVVWRDSPPVGEFKYWRED